MNGGVAITHFDNEKVITEQKEKHLRQSILIVLTSVSKVIN